MQKQFSLFMYSVHEKLIELCPIIKELLVDDGSIRQLGGGGPGGGGGGGPGGNNNGGGGG